MRGCQVCGRMKSLEVIESRDNRLLKQVRKLKIKKHRQENKQFMIEGIRFVEEALLSEASIKYCLCSKGIEGDRAVALVKSLNDRKIDIYVLEDNLMEDICDTKTPQGIAAVVEKEEYNIDGLMDIWEFVVVIDRIQDPGNLGTIIRTADAAGVEGILISTGTVDPYSPKVLRSTMGSVFHIPIIHCPDMIMAIDDLKSRGFHLYISSLKGSSPYYEESYEGKTAIVIGNEANGIDSSIIKHGDKLIKIPMAGKAESLNAAVAGGIMIF